MAEGRTNAAICERLGIGTKNTRRSHRHDLLEARARAEAWRRSTRPGGP